MATTADAYAAAALGGRSGAGTSPCLVVVDLSRGFTDPASPLCCPAEEAVAANVELIAAARRAGWPVVFTTVAYDAAGRRTAAAFLAKSPVLAEVTPDHPWAQIDERLAPADDEPVLTKIFPSAFFGTSLASLLAAQGTDTVLVTGASTSGCVRATVVDALQHGYRAIVPRDACADRAPDAHAASLTDMDAKYADVVGLDEALALLAPATLRPPVAG